MHCRFLLILLCLVTTTPALAASYSVTDLGVLPGGVSSTATSVDPAGEVGGYTTFADDTTQGFIWTQSGGMVAIGGIGSKVFGVSNGNAVGINGNLPFRWTQSTGLVPLDTFGGQANGVVANGQVVGSRNLSGANHRVLTWSASNTQSNPFPTINQTGLALNDLGHFVGQQSSQGFFSDGTPSNLVLLGNFFPNSLSNGDVAAGSQLGIAAYQSIITSTLTSIGTLSGDLTSNALGIDLLGTQIVGKSDGHGGFLYDIATNNLSSLDSLLAADSSSWSILTANAVQAGLIAGQGQFNGQTHAVLLNPVPEPSTLALAAIGALALLAYPIVRTRVNHGER